MLTNPDIQHPTLEIVRAAIEGTPYEGRIWLVGGAVRDALLFQKNPSDLDFVLEGDALEFARWLWDQGISEIFPVTYPRFGTAMVQINGDKVELVCARKEQYQPGSRKPDVVPATLLDDARRRDFTANALFWNVSRSEIFDPLGTGVADLHATILRTPLDPMLTFREDPLRMLRAVRFRYQLGFEAVPALTAGIKAESHRLSIISMERIREEFCKMLLLAKPSQPMQDLADLGLLAQFAPELVALQGIEQGSYHHLDVWGHTLLALDNIFRQDLYLRLAALFHDVAKPQTKFVDEGGKMRFFGHESIGADITAEVLNRLKFSNDEIKHVKTLVRNHMRLGSSPTFSPTAARRLIRELGPWTEDLLDLCEADSNAHHPDMPKLGLDQIREQIARVQIQTPVETLKSPLEGKEIMRILNCETGPIIGKAKAYLSELVLEGELSPDDIVRAKKYLILWASKHFQPQPFKP